MWAWVLLTVAAIGGALIATIDTQVLGFIHDDGVYAATAQALAQGKGFVLPFVPGGMAQVKYPILYPLILAPVWWIQPEFPQNIWLMTALTIAFAMAGLLVWFVYLRRVHAFPAWLAWLILLLVAGNFYNMYFFSTVMSEAPYLFFTLLTLLVAETCYQDKPTLKNLGWVLLLSAFSFHSRVTGLAMVVAVFVWLLSRRAFWHALLYGGVAALVTIVPWYAWVHFNTPSEITPINYPLVNVYSNYTLEFATNFQRPDLYLHGLLGSFGLLVSNTLEALFPLVPHFFRVFPKLKPLRENYAVAITSLVTVLLATYALVGYFLTQGVQSVRKLIQGKLAEGTGFAALYLLIYMLVITVWNYEDQIYRFLVVISPLLWLYFFKPLLGLLRSEKPWRRRVSAGGVILCALVSLVPVWGSYRVIDISRRQHWVESGQAPWLWHDYQRAFTYIRQYVPQGEPIAASNDVVFYLNTGHPAYYINVSSLRKQGLGFDQASANDLMPSLDHYGVKYLVVEPHMRMREIKAPRNTVANYLLQTFPARFQHLYTTPHNGISIYRILPEPSAQP